MDNITLTRLSGLFAILGAILYAIGDVLLLASKVNLDQYPKLKPFAKLLSGAEIMVTLSPSRMIWGALLGVFATPLYIVGYWHMYQGLSGADTQAVLTTIGLFGIGSILGTFVHGTFYFMGEYIHALNDVSDDSQAVIVKMIERHKSVLIISYAPVLICIILASILFSILVASGTTAFPAWMTWVTPLTLTIVWLVGKRILPRFIRERLEGAGFNIAFTLFFVCTTITLWK